MTEQQTPPAASPYASSTTDGNVVWMTVAGLAHVALLSAAFETFRAGSPVRWWCLAS